MVYWILLIASLAVGIPLSRVKYGKEIYCGLMGIVFIVVSAVRFDVGHDFNSYAAMYMNFQKLNVDELMSLKTEKGFAIPLKLLTEVQSRYQIMFVITSIVIVGAIFLYIYKHSNKPYLSVFFFLTFGVLFISFDFLRQMIAAIVVLYALKYVEKKQFARYIAFVLLASLFHISALIMIPFYFILRFKMDWLTLGIYAIATFFLFLFSNDILDFITDYIYKSYDPHKSAEVINGTDPVYAIIFIAFFILAFLLRKKLIEKNPSNNMLLNCLFFTVFFEVMGVKHAILSRFAVLFFIPAFLALLPDVVDMLLEKCTEFFKGERTRGNLLKTIAVVLVFGVCTFTYGYMIENDYNGVSPYQTIADKERILQEYRENNS